MKLLNRTCSLLTGLMFFTGTLFSQQRPCGTTEAQQLLYQKNPDLMHFQDEFDAYCREYQDAHYGKKGGGAIIIPVVFHVIHNYGAENISDAQIEDAIEVLNRDYNKLNADTVNVNPVFKPLIADVQIEFRLARIDPWGNCTNGIDRIVSSKTNVGNDEAKLNPWPRKNYLNIWTVKTIGVSGAAAYAYYPGSVNNVNHLVDGIITLHSYVGSIGTSNVNRSRVLTHEIGHYLNLRHCWGNNNDPGLACGDDQVSDTPKTNGWSFCPASNASALCNPAIPENYQNYMEYSYCCNMFTEGQKQRMLATLNSSVSFRNNLWTPANLALTGVQNPQPLCIPSPDFYANKRFICPGASVAFYGFAKHAPATTYHWSFPGATPAYSNLQNPGNIVFPVAGSYDVKLVVSNNSGSDSILLPGYIKVFSATSDYTDGPVENFESASSAKWEILNPDQNFLQWQLAGVDASSGTQCMMLNGESNAEGDINELISPAYNLNGLSNMVLTFKFAGASMHEDSSLITDEMIIYSSSDCGATWSQRSILSATNLIKTYDFPGSFVPSAAQWSERVIPFSPLFAISNLRLKFKYTSGTATNNFYIDDIGFLNASGLPETSSGLTALHIFPNPVNQETGIRVSLPEKAYIELALYNVLGSKVADIYQGWQHTEETVYPMVWEGSAMPVAGLYFIQLRMNHQPAGNAKIIVE